MGVTSPTIMPNRSATSTSPNGRMEAFDDGEQTKAFDWTCGDSFELHSDDAHGCADNCVGRPTPLSPVHLLSPSCIQPRTLRTPLASPGLVAAAGQFARPTYIAVTPSESHTKACDSNNFTRSVSPRVDVLSHSPSLRRAGRTSCSPCENTGLVRNQSPKPAQKPH